VTRQSLEQEHARLQAEVAELQREHDALEHQHPVDPVAHSEHKAKLRGTIAALKAHAERLRRQVDG
jgi:hypothetical protein